MGSIIPFLFREIRQIMPLSKLKYTLLEADTRPLELILGSFSFAWGVWILVISKNPYSGLFWDAVAIYGGAVFWSVWSLISAVIQIGSITYKYPKLRRFGASLSSVYWVMAGYCLMRTEPRMFIIIMATILAIGQLWIVLRRSAMGK
jgi:hypothetical protein